MLHSVRRQKQRGDSGVILTSGAVIVAVRVPCCKPRHVDQVEVEEVTLGKFDNSDVDSGVIWTLGAVIDSYLPSSLLFFILK
jgi:hypothetical protein